MYTNHTLETAPAHNTKKQKVPAVLWPSTNYNQFLNKSQLLYIYIYIYLNYNKLPQRNQAITIIQYQLINSLKLRKYCQSLFPYLIKNLINIFCLLLIQLNFQQPIEYETQNKFILSSKAIKLALQAVCFFAV